MLFLLLTDLLSVAPGMREGMTFNDLDITPKQKEPTLLNLADLMSAADLDEFNLGDDEDEGESKDKDHVQGHILGEVKLEKSESLENLVKVRSVGSAGQGYASYINQYSMLYSMWY